MQIIRKLDGVVLAEFDTENTVKIIQRSKGWYAIEVDEVGKMITRVGGSKLEIEVKEVKDK